MPCCCRTRDTGDHLDWRLTVEVDKAQEDWREIGDTVDDLADDYNFYIFSFMMDGIGRILTELISILNEFNETERLLRKQDNSIQ